MLLRGVNVNGVAVRSAPLSAALQRAGFTGVRSVLASGNVTLEAPAEDSGGDAAAAVKARVEAALRAEFGYDAWVVVLTARRLAEIAAGYPFPRQDETFHPYVVFTSDASRLADLARLAPAGGDDLLELAGDVLYWRVGRGSSTDTPFARLAAAARWKPFTTTRNLRTVDKLVATTGVLA